MKCAWLDVCCDTTISEGSKRWIKWLNGLQSLEPVNPYSSPCGECGGVMEESEGRAAAAPARTKPRDVPLVDYR